jgi:putative transposon-encoded protein
MTKFEVIGKEMILKDVVSMGGGAAIYVPKKWIGKKAAVIIDVE